MVKQTNALDPENVMIPLKSKEVNYKKKLEILSKFNKTQLSVIWRQIYPRRVKLDPIIRNSRERLIQSIIEKTSLPTINENEPNKPSKRTRTVGKIVLGGLLPGNKKKYSYKYVTIPADGDCFYNAVIQGLNLKNITARELREKLLTKVTDPSVLNRIQAPPTSSRSWAENEEIQATANLYNVCFMIWMEPVVTWQAIYPDPQPKPTNLGTKPCNRVVYLYNKGPKVTSDLATESTGIHFDLLEPIK